MTQKKTPSRKKTPPGPGRLGADIRKRAGSITEGDIERLVDREERITAKLARVPGKFRSLVSQVRLLYEMIRDFRGGAYRETPWYTIAMAAAAILYFMNPLDFIPDWLVISGFLDDAAVLALAFRALRKDLVKYCAFKGYDPEDYF